MNLIEQLGGYESLKREYEETLPLVQKGYKSQSLEVIGKSLLEYRRENNIFEVGDVVVADGDPDFGTCVFSFEDWMQDYIDIHLRHATDAEIKAGHRLELEILNDHDIPPNTTILER